MIGHYVNNLSPAAEDRVLCEKLAVAQHYERGDGCRCLVGVAADYRDGYAYDRPALMRGVWHSRKFLGQDAQLVGYWFDRLCERFSEVRINRAIRNRILSNRARRTLRPVSRETVLETVGR